MPGAASVGLKLEQGNPWVYGVLVNNVWSVGNGAGGSYNLQMSAALLASLPTLVVYILLGRYFMRGRVERVADGYEVRLSGAQSSAMLTAMHHANCLISLAEEQSSFAAGSIVSCIRLDMEEGTP